MQKENADHEDGWNNQRHPGRATNAAMSIDAPPMSIDALPGVANVAPLQWVSCFSVARAVGPHAAKLRTEA